MYHSNESHLGSKRSKIKSRSIPPTRIVNTIEKSLWATLIQSLHYQIVRYKLIYTIKILNAHRYMIYGIRGSYCGVDPSPELERLARGI